MEALNVILPLVIDVLLIVLLVVGIILVIKCIYVVDKTKSILINVEEKVNSLNSFFGMLALVSDRASLVADKVISTVEKIVIKLFKKKVDDLDEEDEIEDIIKKERKRR